MHPFVPAILLRPPWLNALVNDAELHPSERQLRETKETNSCEWRSVVCANTFRHAILAHSSIAHCAHLSQVHACDCLAANQKPAVCIGDRERIAAVTIACQEVPL